MLLIAAMSLMFYSCEKNEIAKDKYKVPDEAKFKLEQLGFDTYMGLESSTPAPFENISYRVVNNKDEFNPYFPEAMGFYKYYDSIVMSSPILPETVCLYKKTDEKYFRTRFSTHFFEAGNSQIIASGYKDGEIIYEYSIEQKLQTRDFLCVDWEHVKVSEDSDNSYQSSFCIFDTKRNFRITNIQKHNDTYFIEVYITGAIDYPEKQKAELRWLLERYVGESTGVDVSEFKTLPQDVDVVSVYEDNKNRAALLHKGNHIIQSYYVVVECK